MEKDLKIRISIDKKTGAVKVIGSEFDTLDNKIKKTEKSANSLEKTFLKYVSIGAVLYGVKQGFDSAFISANKFIDRADDMVLVSSRLSLVTESTQEFAKAQRELLTISNNARTSIRSTSDLYTQLNRSTKELGLSQSTLLQVTDTVSKTLTISGASAQAADAALLQLSQGMASGVLRGEELNSILEQTPRLAQAIADGMGVSVGQLRSLGAEGQLTSEKVLTALQSQSEIVNAEFSKIAINAQSGYTVLNNYIDTTVAKINEQYKVTQTVGQVYIAFGQTIETIFNQLNMSWDSSSDKALWFANTTADVVVSFINGMGYVYDVLETIGDQFNVLRYAGETAFYGIQVVSANVANAIVSTFEFSFNMVIDGINNIINYINSLGFISLPTIGAVDLGSEQTQARVKYVEEKFNEAYNNLSQAASDVLETGEGQAWAEKISSTFRESFDNLLEESRQRQEENNSNNSSNSVVDTSDDSSIFTDPIDTTDSTNNSSIIGDTNNTNIDNITSTIDDTNSSIGDLNNSLGSDDGTYNVVTQTRDKVDNLNDTIRDTGTTARTAQKYIFQFSNTLKNSFESNANSLQSIISSTSSVVELTYADALSNMEKAKAALIANPLDKGIGVAYADAYNALVDTVGSHLNKSNFATSQDYQFALASVSTQLNGYKNTAAAGYSVLDSMNDFLSSINKAFEDGILSDEEKQTISNVATTVNANNDVLLGSSSAIVNTVNSQEYYNNTGLARSTDLSQNAIVVSNAIGEQEYYNNIGLARSTDLVQNANSVTGAVDQLSGAKSIADLLNVSETISSATGLTKDEIIAVGTGINTTTLAVDGTTRAVIDTPVKVQQQVTNVTTLTGDANKASRLNNLLSQIRSLSIQNPRYGTQAYVTLHSLRQNLASGNYAKGGYTGEGVGLPDHTGFKVAGITHEGEWVAPKWMLKQNPSTFSQLEEIRQKGSFAEGGYTSTKVNLPSKSINTNIALEKELTDLKKLAFTQTQQLIKLNRTILKLSNGGQALLVEGLQ